MLIIMLKVMMITKNKIINIIITIIIIIKGGFPTRLALRGHRAAFFLLPLQLRNRQAPREYSFKKKNVFS